MNQKPTGLLLAQEELLFAGQPGLMDRLQPADRARVRAHGHQRIVERGETLFRQGEPHTGIAVIETGLLRSFYTSPSGREITLAYWMAGNFVGGPDLFGGGIHVWTAVAARRSTVMMLPAEGLRELARAVPDLALGLLDALAFKARCYSSLAQMLGTRSMTERLAQVLLHMAHIYEVEDADRRRDEVVLAASFTHAEIANLIGATRQWVTISLNRFQAAGLLTQKRGIMTIHRLDLLSVAASGQPLPEGEGD